MKAFFNRIHNSYKRKGFLEFFKLLFMRCLIYLLAFPMALILILISPIVRIRLIKLYSHRIGQYGGNTHLMLCALDSKDFADQYRNLFYATPSQPICNQHFHQMWKRVIPILPWGEFWFFVDKLLIMFGGEKYNSLFKKHFEGSEGDYDKWRYFQRTNKCYLSFLEEEKKQGQALTRQLGIPEGANFVCLLVRDPAY